MEPNFSFDCLSKTIDFEIWLMYYKIFILYCILAVCQMDKISRSKRLRVPTT